MQKPPLDPRLLEFAREMRREATTAENMIWQLVRNRRCGGYKFRRQATIGNFIVDFYCHEGRLVVELDGGYHNDPLQEKHDADRTEALKKMGINVARFWDTDVLKHLGAVLSAIYDALEPVSEERAIDRISTSTPPSP